MSRALYRQHRPNMTEDEIDKAIQKEFSSKKLAGGISITDPRNLALNATNSVVSGVRTAHDHVSRDDH